ncbi:class I SAM-dependent methyltransferase [Hyphomonas sp.]|uniref:class I SAM-dependent methyltransferase n=1 Tax=Hyphomonas sp. TaxID=87 RepID=UPI000A50FC1B|nr:class I SAM-dependent methyltransferase [Hyphomonas sp.]
MDNTAQIDYWNGAAGQKWVRDADRLDKMLRAYLDAVMDAAKPKAGEVVTDIGCGGGALSLAVAGKGAIATGVDVSEPLIEVARRRAAVSAPGTRFVVADASEWTPEAAADLIVSRFGVMFFADPVRAFANIRKGAAPGGRLAFVCWRPLAENEWALAPIIAAMPFLREAPKPPEPGAPGPFAFGQREHIDRILTEAGWKDVRISPWDGQIELPGATAPETAEFMLEIGPLSRTISEQGLDPEKIKAALVARVAGLADAEGRTRLKAAIWIVEATA